MIQHHNWSLTELDNMLPWEREIYSGLLIQYLQDEKEEYERQQRILSETDMATKRGELLGQNFIDNLSNSEIISLQNKVTDTQNNINMYSTTEGNIAENTDIINISAVSGHL